jgi:hypothetical protein
MENKDHKDKESTKDAAESPRRLSDALLRKMIATGKSLDSKAFEK